MKILIKGGRVIDPSQGLDAKKDLLIEKGVVLDLVPPGESVKAKVIDASGKWVVPGLVDMHVHLREPGEEYKETIATGCAAAAAGGITALACMPNTKNPNDNASVTDYILEKAEEAKKARVYPVGALSRGRKGAELAEIGELAEHGCVAVTDDGSPVMNSGLMRRALEYCKGVGIPVLDHPEDPQLSAGGCMHEGEVSTDLGLPGMPSAAEEIMVARDIILSELTGSPIHLQHLSTGGSVRLVKLAKERGLRVTAETCPHYIALTHEAVRGYDTSFKMNPPLRTEEDRQALIQGLADGTIDAVASDHAPHSAVEKDLEFDRAENGVAGLETLLPISLSLVHDEVITPYRWVELVSTNPARILAIPAGTLVQGAAADVTVIDPKAQWTVDRDKFKSKGRYTPFHGWKVKGRAAAVLVRGRPVK